MTKTVLTAALLTVAALCGSQARAQQTSNPCDQAVTQMDMNQCSAGQYKKADAQLNTVYAAILKWLKSDKIAVQKLTAAEKQWIRYRDLHCNAVMHQSEGGSIAPLMWSSCMEALAKDRIEEIRNGYETPDVKF
jgi:uncharacterized protein YecT (DUF1311 family)